MSTGEGNILYSTLTPPSSPLRESNSISNLPNLAIAKFHDFFKFYKDVGMDYDNCFYLALEQIRPYLDSNDKENLLREIYEISFLHFNTRKFKSDHDPIR